MTDRKIIFKSRVGSYLYGTNNSNSDEDFLGVFLPSLADMFGLDECEPEIEDGVKLSQGEKNAKGDIDSKCYSLKRFISLAMKGQPACLELLFAPAEAVIIQTPEWEQIKELRHLFLSKQGVIPFANFAQSQSFKSEIKGFNLNLIRSLLALKPSIGEKGLLNMPLSYFLKNQKDDEIFFKHNQESIQLRYLEKDHKGKLHPMIEVAGLDFDFGLRVKTFLVSLLRIESKYGSRSESAAKSIFDYKSLSHAYRLLSEGKEFLETGKITLPCPNADFLKRVKNQEYQADFRKELTSLLDELYTVCLPKSPLPDAPERDRLNELCILIYQNHFKN